MSVGAFWIVFAVYVFALAAFTAWLAGERGRDNTTWFVLGLFFGVFALITVGLAPMVPEAQRKRKPELEADKLDRFTEDRVRRAAERDRKKARAEETRQRREPPTT